MLSFLPLHRRPHFALNVIFYFVRLVHYRDNCVAIYIYIYIDVRKSNQRMNLWDVGSETSVSDSVQTNKNDK
jgi:hypothetical protein